MSSLGRVIVLEDFLFLEDTWIFYLHPFYWGKKGKSVDLFPFCDCPLSTHISKFSKVIV